MSSKEGKGYEQILDAMGDMAVYIMHPDTHKILFCNEQAKKGDVQAQSKRLFALWDGQRDKHLSQELFEGQPSSKLVFDDAVKKEFRVTVSRILWVGESALLIAAEPVMQMKGEAMHRNLLENIDVIISEGYIHSCLVNLTRNESINLWPTPRGGEESLQKMSYDKKWERVHQRIHTMHMDEVQAIFSLENLRHAYKAGKQRISHDYLLQNKAGVYRWVRGSAVFRKNINNGDAMAVLLWREIEGEKGIARQLLMEQEALFNSLPGYILKIAVEDDIEFLDASKTFQDFFGAIDQTYRVGDNIFQEDKAFVLNEIKEKGREGLPISFECRVCDKMGKIVWLQGEGRVVGYQGKAPIYLMILIDISAVKETQIQLFQERERYRVAVVDMAAGIFEYYIQEDYLVYHKTQRDKQKTTKLWRYMEKLKTSSTFSKEGAVLFAQILRGESNGGEIEILMEGAHRREWYVCQGNPIYEDGVLRKVVGTLRSVDGVKREQKKAEEMLASEKKKNQISNQRFLQAVNRLYDLIIEVDLQTQETYIWKDSPHYGSLIPRDQTLYHFLVHDCFDYIDPEYHEGAKNAFSPVLLLQEFRMGKNEVMMELPVQGPKGKYRWNRIQVQPLEENNGLLRLMIYIKDIDEQKSREACQQDALKDALRLAKRANAAKGDFLSRMSHDVRTPLNAIMGMTAIAQAHSEERERVEDCLSKINSSSKYLLELINDILEMSKIESGKMTLTIKEFDIHSLLQEPVVYGYTQSQLKEHEFSVTIREGTEGIFEGDSLRITQILMNLLSNAFKYTQPKGRINLNVKGRAMDEGTVLLQMEVRDNGMGIEKNYKEKLFIPFEQGEGGIQSGGTGLGLAISQNLAMLMGGQIFVDSETGKGSAFYVEIPLTKKSAEFLPSAPPKDLGVMRGEEVSMEALENVRVLLAEDNEINVEIAKTLLEMSGVSVDVARNGQECIALFDQSPENTYLAILMDVQMPVMNGYEATKSIRKLDRQDALQIPILAMTANAFSSDIGETLAAGMTEHIAKPIDMNVLLSLLKKYVLLKEQKR